MFSFLAGHTCGQSAAEVLEKMIKAQGGREKLAAIKDTTITGSFEMTSMGMEGEMTAYQKEPNLLRMDIEIMGTTMTQAYDGKTAWMVDSQNGTVEVMPEIAADYFIREAYGNAAILEPDKFGISYSLKGNEEIEGKEYIVLVQTFSDDFKVTIYIDPETYLIYKTKSLALDEMMMETESEVVYSNYKEIDGVLTAFNMTIYEGALEDFVFTASEVKYNTGLEDSFFERE
jgi:outer membrane lipoprotein-sorting protein